MSQSHPLDWNTASEVPGGKPWISLIGGGLLLQVFGGILIGIGASAGSDQSGGTSHAGVTALVFGSILAWVGFVLLLVGLIAVGVYLGSRHLDGRLPVAESRASGPAGNRAAGLQAAGDRTAFAANADDSPVVAQVRAMYLTGAQFALKATTASVRRIASRAERRGQLTDADRATIEAMIVEAHRTEE